MSLFRNTQNAPVANSNPLSFPPKTYTQITIPANILPIPPNNTYAGNQPLYARAGSSSSLPTNATFSTVTASTVTINSNLVLDGNVLTTDSGGELLLNGIPIATTHNISSITEWSYYPAISSINCNTNNILNAGDFVFNNNEGAISGLSTINGVAYVPGGGGGVSTNTITGTTTIDLADGGLSVVPTIATITAQNGSFGRVEITGNPGTGGNSGGAIKLLANGGSGVTGLFGQIDITANSGSGSGVTTGGKINIVANSGLSDPINLTSAVNISGAGITSQAGYTVPVASLAGYNFIGGNSGVSICGGLPPTLPTTIGTLYLYGTTGVNVGSGLSFTNVKPYQYGIINAEDIVIAGSSLDVGLGNHTAYVNLSTCKNISFGGVGDPVLGQITGLSTINGAPYVSGGGGGGTSISQADGIVSVGTSGQINIFPATGQPTLINNSISMTANDITGVGNITIQDGITLEGGGTITINGSSGSPGQVIGIAEGDTYPSWTSPKITGGKYECSGDEITTITFDITGMNANGLVSAIIINPGTGGAGQWIKSITPGAGNVTIEVGIAVSLGDSVIWSVINFGTAV